MNTTRFTRAARLGRTVRYLKPAQIGWRIWRRLRRARVPAPAAAPALRALTGTPGPGLRRHALSAGPTFTFLNEARRFDDGIVWLDAGRGKLWTYNLHYFDYLDEAVDRFGESYAEALVRDWIVANPAPLGDGWEPYPTSLRLVNWTRWVWRCRIEDRQILDSLAHQTRWLMRNLEHHIRANHLFANLKAVLCAGLLFDGSEGRAWLHDGQRRLLRELDEQWLRDGGHYELSPMYHATLLNDLLDLLELGDASGTLPDTTLQGWRDRIEPALGWLATMSHPDGEIAFFNDAAFGIAPSVAELAGRARSLGLHSQLPDAHASRHLVASGYARLANSRAVVLIDAARIGPDHQPGHAHADTLSFELSLDGRRVLVNGGTSTYIEGATRHAQRATRAHNTVEIDGQDSSEVWASHRVARRAVPFDVRAALPDGAPQSVHAAHDGYRRLPSPVVHRRDWRLERDRLVITDTIEGTCRLAIARFHVHPDLVMSADGQLLHRQRCIARWSVDGGRVERVDTRWYPGFGAQRPNQCLQVTFEGERLRLTLCWHGDPDR